MPMTRNFVMPPATCRADAAQGRIYRSRRSRGAVCVSTNGTELVRAWVRQADVDEGQASGVSTAEGRRHRLGRSTPIVLALVIYLRARLRGTSLENRAPYQSAVTNPRDGLSSCDRRRIAKALSEPASTDPIVNVWSSLPMMRMLSQTTHSSPTIGCLYNLRL